MLESCSVGLFLTVLFCGICVFAEDYQRVGHASALFRVLATWSSTQTTTGGSLATEGVVLFGGKSLIERAEEHDFYYFNDLKAITPVGRKSGESRAAGDRSYAWREVVILGPTPSPREGHSLSTIQMPNVEKNIQQGDNLIALFGGYAGMKITYSNDLFTLRIDKMEDAIVKAKWEKPSIQIPIVFKPGSPRILNKYKISTSPNPVPRYRHTANAIYGHLVIFGGQSQQGLLSDVAIIDLNTFLTPSTPSTPSTTSTTAPSATPALSSGPTRKGFNLLCDDGYEFQLHQTKKDADICKLSATGSPVPEATPTTTSTSTSIDNSNVISTRKNRCPVGCVEINSPPWCNLNGFDLPCRVTDLRYKTIEVRGDVPSARAGHTSVVLRLNPPRSGPLDCILIYGGYTVMGLADDLHMLCPVLASPDYPIILRLEWLPVSLIAPKSKLLIQRLPRRFGTFAESFYQSSLLPMNSTNMIVQKPFRVSHGVCYIYGGFGQRLFEDVYQPPIVQPLAVPAIKLTCKTPEQIDFEKKVTKATPQVATSVPDAESGEGGEDNTEMDEKTNQEKSEDDDDDTELEEDKSQEEPKEEKEEEEQTNKESQEEEDEEEDKASEDNKLIWGKLSFKEVHCLRDQFKYNTLKSWGRSSTGTRLSDNTLIIAGGFYSSLGSSITPKSKQDDKAKEEGFGNDLQIAPKLLPKGFIMSQLPNEAL